MNKRFKSKRYKHLKIKFYVLIIIFSFIVYLVFLNNNNEEKIVELYLNTVKNDIKTELTKTYISINSPENVIYSSLNKKIKKKELSAFNIKEDNFNYKKSHTDYVEDPNPKVVKNPIVYLYNTHQLEEYYGETPNNYNVKPNVLIASYMLKEKLNNKNIPTIVETSNIKKYIEKHNLKYYESYKASRHFIIKRKKENKNLKYFIDIHRDSISRSKSTLKYKNKKYAKVVFVIGTEFNNYKNNMKFAKSLSNKINIQVPNLSKGIIKKSGKGVNGIYNEDVDNNLILIEVGGVGNTIEEVNNTLEVLANSIESYIRG